MSKVENILKAHYKDMLGLNKDFISAIARPKPIGFEKPLDRAKMKSKPTKKQLKALARGRKILASNRLKIAK